MHKRRTQEELVLPSLAALVRFEMSQGMLDDAAAQSVIESVRRRHTTNHRAS